LRPCRSSETDSPTSDSVTTPAHRPAQFTTTHWSVVLAAGSPDSHQAATALETLCRTYWYPLYAYARRCGQSAPDAEDSVQSFLARFLSTRIAGTADRNRGRFRSFLLVAFKRFLANEWDRRQARKRGSGRVISWESLEAEQRYALEPADVASPDRLYDRRWAMTLLANVLDRLEAEQQGPAR
jgi:RNA polymerase sigma-70 factor (ECF subfamily)